MKTWSIIHAVTSVVWQVLITARVYQEEKSYRINTVLFLTESVCSGIFLNFPSTEVFDLNIDHDVTLPIYSYILSYTFKIFHKQYYKHNSTLQPVKRHIEFSVQGDG